MNFGAPPEFTPRIIRWLQGPPTVRPFNHEPWCAERTGDGYPENNCTCDLEERQAQWIARIAHRTQLNCRAP